MSKNIDKERPSERAMRLSQKSFTKIKAQRQAENVKKKAFYLLTICRFILAKVPIVLGYAEHERAFDEVNRLASQLNGRTEEIEKVIHSKAWALIQIILDLDEGSKQNDSLKKVR